MSRNELQLTSTRFVAVGLSNAIIGFVVFWSCFKILQVPLKAGLSQLASYAVGITWSFYWNRRWTFRSRGSAARQAVRFAALQVTLALVSSTALSLAVDILGQPPILCWLIVMSLITLLNYTLSRFWAFR